MTFLNEKRALQCKKNTVLTRKFDNLIENTGTGSDKVIPIIAITPLGPPFGSLVLFAPLALNSTISLVDCGRIKRGKHVLKPSL